MKFKVLRHHIGDRPYEPGEVREALERDVAHLVARGVLEAKAEERPRNKAVSSAPKNKAASAAARKNDK